MRLKATKMNNYAEQLIKETQPEQEDWNAENFQNWLYPNTQEQYNTAGRGFPENSACPQYSGSSNNSKDTPSFFIHELPESSFKFNYKHENKDPLEELGIEVVK